MFKSNKKLIQPHPRRDPISAYLFILVLEIFVIMIKSNNNVHSLNIFDNKCLYTAYADKTLRFLKDIHFIKKCFKRPKFVF